tara:strand:- start:36871 stop:39279 length:2409 start_codon:yes stop_codon:yes gene_type:complete
MTDLADNKFTFGTKAETLYRLDGHLKKCTIPKFFYFTVKEWHDNPQKILEKLKLSFDDSMLIVRSSAANEDSSDTAMAGEYLSIANVHSSNEEEVIASVNDVIESYRKLEKIASSEDQVLVQEMTLDVSMSGVLFTKDMNSGAPYYVINYDDETGRTDTISSGTGYSNRTLYIHREYGFTSLKSERFLSLIDAVKEIESFVSSDMLDIEFAIDNLSYEVNLLQVRRITTQKNWIHDIDSRINDSLDAMKSQVDELLRPLDNAYGDSAILGRMPDWNPAEIIGTAPRQLAYSLYDYLITNSAWRIARDQMGYCHPHGRPLMSSLSGQPFIDVRLSFFSYLPKNLPSRIGKKLVNAWLDKLRSEPHLHDKVEFDVATTTFNFNFFKQFKDRYPKLLTDNELEIMGHCFLELTKGHIQGETASIDENLKMLETLEIKRSELNTDDDYLNAIESMANDCMQFGTIPFSILARHGFIAKSLLDSIVSLGILTVEDVERFQKTIPTVATEFIRDLNKFSLGQLQKEEIIDNYGHLRPGTYDILSIPYKARDDLIIKEKNVQKLDEEIPEFELSEKQHKEIQSLLDKYNFSIGPEFLFDYIRRSIQAREYSKFIFTKSLNYILELLEKWGINHEISKEDLSFIDFSELLEKNTANYHYEFIKIIHDSIEQGKKSYQITERILLPSLISEKSDLFVVPLLIGEPNFITNKIISEHAVTISGKDVDPEIIDGKIVLIENADPGFDWIFTRDVKGLVTKYGGANSHMAIRCAEFGLPAAIGCGEQIFLKLEKSNKINLNCSERTITSASILE